MESYPLAFVSEQRENFNCALDNIFTLSLGLAQYQYVSVGPFARSTARLLPDTEETSQVTCRRLTTNAAVTRAIDCQPKHYLPNDTTTAI